MRWKIIASAFGWRPARDKDKDCLVVRHPKFRRGFTGSNAWKHAVLLSIRAPAAIPDGLEEGLP